MLLKAAPAADRLQDHEKAKDTAFCRRTQWIHSSARTNCNPTTKAMSNTKKENSFFFTQHTIRAIVISHFWKTHLDISSDFSTKLLVTML